MVRKQELARLDERKAGPLQENHGVIAGSAVIENPAGSSGDPDSKPTTLPKGYSKKQLLKTQLMTMNFDPRKGEVRSKTSLHSKKPSVTLKTLANTTMTDGQRVRVMKQHDWRNIKRHSRPKSFLQLSHRSSTPRGGQDGAHSRRRKQDSPLAEVDVQKKPIHYLNDKDFALQLDPAVKRMYHARLYRKKQSSLGKDTKLTHILSHLTEEDAE